MPYPTTTERKVVPGSWGKSPAQDGPSVMVSGIQDQMLEVTVVGFKQSEDEKWFSRHCHPYIRLEYNGKEFHTSTGTCKDGDENHIFQEEFKFMLRERLQELNVVVLHKSCLKFTKIIGSGKVHLQQVLSRGYDDTTWSLQTKKGRYAGKVHLKLHYRPAPSFAPSTQAYGPPHAPCAPAPAACYPPATAYHAPSPYPPPYSQYPPPSYPPPPQMYPRPPQATPYCPPSNFL